MTASTVYIEFDVAGGRSSTLTFDHSSLLSCLFSATADDHSKMYICVFVSQRPTYVEVGASYDYQVRGG